MVGFLLISTLISILLPQTSANGDVAMAIKPIALLFIVSSFSVPVYPIATRRDNAIKGRPLRIYGGSTEGENCDGGLVVSPDRKEISLSWNLGAIYYIDKVKVKFAPSTDLSSIQELRGHVGFADSNFFTKFQTSDPNAPLSTSNELKPMCFEQKQWGGAGSTFKLTWRSQKKIAFECIEVDAFKEAGKNVFMAKPVRSGDGNCKRRHFLINDNYYDGHVNIQEPPFELVADLGRVYSLTKMNFDVKGEWDSGEVELMKNYLEPEKVSGCKKEGDGKHSCPLNGKEVRFLRLKSNRELPKVLEIQLLT